MAKRKSASAADTDDDLVDLFPRRADAAVGYGRPPQAGQFVKGKSGNPKGRPTGTGKRRNKSQGGEEGPRSLDELLLSEAHREVTLVNRSGKSERVTLAEAAIKALTAKAATGNNPAIRTFVQELGRAERAAIAARRQDPSPIAVGLELQLAAVLIERSFGPTFPPKWPRADEVDIDFVTGVVTLRRPMGDEEQADWDGCALMKQEIDAELSHITRLCDSPHFAGLGVELQNVATTLRQIAKAVDKVLIYRWHLKPQELAAPLRHTQALLTLDDLRPGMSEPVRRLLGKAEVVLLRQKILRRGCEVAAGQASALSEPSLDALKERLYRHPSLPERLRGMRQEN